MKSSAGKFARPLLQRFKYHLAQFPRSSSFQYPCCVSQFGQCRSSGGGGSGSTSESTSSIDPTELNHFNNLASSWWDPHGPSRLLHLMNPLRHSFISSCRATAPPPTVSTSSQSTQSQNHMKGVSYLDIGCGGGIFAESAARLPDTSSVIGIDPSAEVLAVARTHARRDPTLARPRNGDSSSATTTASPNFSAGLLQYRQCGIETLDKSLGPWQIVTLFEVLEHVNSPSAFLRDVTPHVAAGGWLIISTIARTWTSWITTKVVAEDALRIVPRGTHDWDKYINEPELRHWFMQGEGRGMWERPRAMGVMYVPGLGWKEVGGGENWGNYFFGIRKREDA